MAQKNYYTILGIRQHATTEDIKRAYRQLAFRYHPDHNKGGISGEDRFREIKEAYEVLIHAQERKKHDAELRAQHIYAPSYDFGKYSQANPNSPRHPKDITRPNGEYTETEKAPVIKPWYIYFIKPAVFLAIALLLMRLIMDPPYWLKNLFGDLTK